MELNDLALDKDCIKDLIPSRTGGEGLTVWYAADAITPRDRRRIMALEGKEDEAEVVMMMLEAMGVEWNLKAGGVPVLPLRKLPADVKAEADAKAKKGEEPAYPPTMEDVSLKALVTILQAITEAARPKETSAEASSAG